ncbi:GTPase IMAP family member 8-like protein [Anopheles sinensis]|uniref:GTPase IMAP family member 8-like protein n=1 Tax=Anopheles sinensis TaxID=74873 RepID=A0A084VD87_ANOSI|nr:GTPase IMAP family member 8-like protein [Anopheles sinensis]
MLASCRNWINKQRKKSRWSRCTDCEQHSTEFVCVNLNQIPTESARRQSLPRRLLGRFLSENNVNGEAEQLKEFLKEKGLYFKHQSLQQRRRLKELLDLEQRYLLADIDRVNGSLELQSLQCPRNDRVPQSTPKPAKSSHVPSGSFWPLRNAISLSALPANKILWNKPPAMKVHTSHGYIETAV